MCAHVIMCLSTNSSECVAKRKLPVYVFLFRTCNETSLLWEVIVLWYRPALLQAWNENNLLGLDRTLTQVINYQSQPRNFMKMGFPGSSSAFSSLFFIQIQSLILPTGVEVWMHPGESNVYVKRPILSRYFFVHNVILYRNCWYFLW